MFVSLHQQLHNFKRESMKLLREVEHIVMWSIPFCHNTLGPLKLGYHRGRRSGVHTVNQLCKVCQWCFVIYRCQCLCHSEGRNVISSEECISKSCIISVLVLFCSSSLLWNHPYYYVMKCHDFTDKEIQNILLPVHWHCRERKRTAEWKLHTAMNK